MIVCLGAFDGYHRGHFTLFEAARALACEQKTDWKIVTFAPHPRFVLGGLTARLFNHEEKQILRGAFGLADSLAIPFTKKFAATEPAAFLDELRGRLSLSGIVVGDTFRFGRNRSGDAKFLTEYCSEKNLLLCLMPQLVTSDGVVISSTRVRDLVSAGTLEEAAGLLGYPYFIVDTVVHGESRGHTMGLPTANMTPDENKLIPGEGVYAGALFHSGEWHPAAISVGRNPTFLVQGSLRIEAHVMDFSGDLYGARPMLVFFKQLRLMTRFAGSAELTSQIARDCESTRRIFAESAAELKKFHILPATL